jgi:hypothetical protein
LAIGVSRVGALLMLLWLVALLWAYWRDRRAPAGRLSTVLAITALLTAIYLALVSWVYLDAARLLPSPAVAPETHAVAWLLRGGAA